MASRGGSITGSLHSDSLASTFNSVSEASKKRNPSLWSYYSEADQEVLSEARILILHEMATSVGWPILADRDTGHKRWSPIIREILSQVCCAMNKGMFFIFIRYHSINFICFRAHSDPGNRKISEYHSIVKTFETHQLNPISCSKRSRTFVGNYQIGRHLTQRLSSRLMIQRWQQMRSFF
jgi:hypothetical protein